MYNTLADNFYDRVEIGKFVPKFERKGGRIVRKTTKSIIATSIIAISLLSLFTAKKAFPDTFGIIREGIGRDFARHYTKTVRGYNSLGGCQKERYKGYCQ